MTNDPILSLTSATCNVIIALDALAQALDDATEQLQLGRVEVARLGISRDVLAKGQQALWEVLNELDKRILEVQQNG